MVFWCFFAVFFSPVCLFQYTSFLVSFLLEMLNWSSNQLYLPRPPQTSNPKALDLPFLKTATESWVAQNAWWQPFPWRTAHLVEPYFRAPQSHFLGCSKPGLWTWVLDLEFQLFWRLDITENDRKYVAPVVWHSKRYKFDEGGIVWIATFNF